MGYSPANQNLHLLSSVGVVELATDEGPRGRTPKTPLETVDLSLSLDGTAEERAVTGHSGPSTDAEKIDWISAVSIKGAPTERAPTNTGRGDVVWVPTGDRTGLPLLVLSHDLPPEADHVSGVALTLGDSEDPDDDPAERTIIPAEWEQGGLTITSYPLPWAAHSVARNQSQTGSAP